MTKPPGGNWATIELDWQNDPAFLEPCPNGDSAWDDGPDEWRYDSDDPSKCSRMGIWLHAGDRKIFKTDPDSPYAPTWVQNCLVDGIRRQQASTGCGDEQCTDCLIMDIGEWKQNTPRNKNHLISLADLESWQSRTADVATACQACQNLTPYELKARLLYGEEIKVDNETLTVNQPVAQENDGAAIDEHVRIQIDTTEPHNSSGHGVVYPQCVIDMSVDYGNAFTLMPDAWLSRLFPAISDIGTDVVVSPPIQIKAAGQSGISCRFKSRTSDDSWQTGKMANLKLTLPSLEAIRQAQAPAGAEWTAFLDEAGSCGQVSTDKVTITIKIYCDPDHALCDGTTSGDPITLTIEYNLATAKLEAGRLDATYMLEQKDVENFDMITDDGEGEDAPYNSLDDGSVQGDFEHGYRIINYGAVDLTVGFETTEHKMRSWGDGQGDNADGCYGPWVSDTKTCWNYPEMYICEGAQKGDCGGDPHIINFTTRTTWTRKLRALEQAVIKDYMVLHCHGGEGVDAGCHKCKISIFNDVG